MTLTLANLIGWAGMGCLWAGVYMEYQPRRWFSASALFLLLAGGACIVASLALMLLEAVV